jgi:RNA-directed DNA polymerase
MIGARRSPDLLARVADEVNLRAAWRAVRQKKGREGLDGVSLQAFQANVDTELLNIERALSQHGYQPRALKRIPVLKRDQRRRIISIPTVADRVVQHAILKVLEPHFEPSFCRCGARS